MKLETKVFGISALLGLLFLLSLTCTQTVKAATIEIGFGDGRYQDTDMWYDKRYPYEISQPKYVWSLGLKGDLTQNIEWSLGYLDLGKFKIDALALSDDSKPSRGFSRFVSTAHVTGWYATIRPGITTAYGRYFAELGVFITKPPFQVEMHNMPMGYDENDNAYDCRTVTGTHEDKWRIKSMYGVGVSNAAKTMALSFNYVMLGHQDQVDQYVLPYKSASTLMLKMAF